ncbi:uncharacterized protein WM294_014028 isoform 1-T1 [Sarcoramphus papa]
MQSFPRQVGNPCEGRNFESPLAKRVSLRPVFPKLIATKPASVVSSRSRRSGGRPLPTARPRSRDGQELRQADSCRHGLCAEAQPVRGDRRGAAMPAAFLGSPEEPE